jgi:hypothetical protein
MAVGYLPKHVAFDRVANLHHLEGVPTNESATEMVGLEKAALV